MLREPKHLDFELSPVMLPTTHSSPVSTTVTYIKSLYRRFMGCEKKGVSSGVDLVILEGTKLRSLLVAFSRPSIGKNLTA
ncbi:hypothetical protein TNCV_3323311 [Trichonephila clavipes]|nr:hypothetical protein TNCV_3323311 [Trichonephila clavipes]